MHPLILADDRSGAIETAALVATRSGAPVEVHAFDTTLPTASDSGAPRVIDLGSRGISPFDAAHRSVVSSGTAPCLHLHKIDSSLRGNWAAECVARAAHLGVPVVVIAAYPALGRTCTYGEVRIGGVPLDATPAGRDPVAPVRSARPETALAAAAAVVEHAADATQLASWLRSQARTGSGSRTGQPTAAVVCDASTDADVQRLLDAAATGPHLLAAPAGPIAEAAVRCFPGSARPAVPKRSSTGTGASEALVVCGSVHPSARQQLDQLRLAHGSGRRLTLIEVLATPTAPLDARSASNALNDIATAARHWSETHPHGVVVAVGGDTAARVIADDPVTVLGLLDPSNPAAFARCLWRGRQLLVRPGGFGAPDALTESLAAAMDARMQS